MAKKEKKKDALPHSVAIHERAVEDKRMYDRLAKRKKQIDGD